MIVPSRASKQVGDFGEGVVAYALIIKHYHVVRVDDVGADLIASKDGRTLAISVKTRLFKVGSKESLTFVVETDHIEKLEHFAHQFGMTPVFALFVCVSDEHLIHLLIMPVDELKKNRDCFAKAKHGYSIRFSPGRRKALISKPFVDYSCWKEERLRAEDLFSAHDT